jgi:hypothetical protein
MWHSSISHCDNCCCAGKWDLALVDYGCCAHGWSDPDFVPDAVSVEYCDTNILHTPYSLTYTSTSYDSGADQTTVQFRVSAWSSPRPALLCFTCCQLFDQ